jgi:hypothetical protein
MTTRIEPHSWGNDELSNYLRAYRDNQLATFANKGQSMSDLIAIDRMFQRFLINAINPRPFYPINFMLRAHSAFRSATAAVMGGQLYEAQALLRLCLEHAAYGYYIGANSERLELWLRRSESEEHRRAVRKAFHNDKLKDHIKAQAPVMCAQFDHLYNQLIEFGAHPNEQGYSLHSEISRQEGDVHFQTIYLQDDGPRLEMSMKLSGQVGLWVLHLMQLIYPERYELLGLREELETVRTRF